MADDAYIAWTAARELGMHADVIEMRLAQERVNALGPTHLEALRDLVEAQKPTYSHLFVDAINMRAVTEAYVKAMGLSEAWLRVPPGRNPILFEQYIR